MAKRLRFDGPLGRFRVARKGFDVDTATQDHQFAVRESWNNASRILASGIVTNRRLADGNITVTHNLGRELYIIVARIVGGVMIFDEMDVRTTSTNIKGTWVPYEVRPAQNGNSFTIFRQTYGGVEPFSWSQTSDWIWFAIPVGEG